MDVRDHDEQTKPDIDRLDMAEMKDEVVGNAQDDLTPRTAWCLYLSHFLSMWISRTYEYATVGMAVTASLNF